MRILWLSAIFAFAMAAAQWNTQTSGVDTNLRGLSIVSPKGSQKVPEIWASGSHGMILHSKDAGKTWAQLHVKDGESLDFRGIRAFGGGLAYAMASGEGEATRIYKTIDDGKNWELQFQGNRKEIFLDAIVCRDESHCFALGDPVDGKFLVLATSDGKTWKPLANEGMPPALAAEGAFAASNSSLILSGNHDLYFATGGPAARAFHSADSGKTWTVTETPLTHGEASAGIFAIARLGNVMVAVGGDYKQPEASENCAVYSTDAGKTWHAAEDFPGGYRSGLAAAPGLGFVAVGPGGSDLSQDGIHWKHLDGTNLNVVSFLQGSGWAGGPKGLVTRFANQEKGGM